MATVHTHWNHVTKSGASNVVPLLMSALLTNTIEIEMAKYESTTSAIFCCDAGGAPPDDDMAAAAAVGAGGGSAWRAAARRDDTLASQRCCDVVQILRGE